MKAWKEFTHFAALDWAKDHHDVVVVDRQGTVVADFRIAHDCAGWQLFAEKLRRYEAVAVAIETSEGPAVEQLLASGFDVYPINPKSARRYRERKRPSGFWACPAKRLALQISSTLARDSSNSLRKNNYSKLRNKVSRNGT
jgi:hypothetical protein